VSREAEKVRAFLSDSWACRRQTRGGWLIFALPRPSSAGPRPTGGPARAFTAWATNIQATLDELRGKEFEGHGKVSDRLGASRASRLQIGSESPSTSRRHPPPSTLTGAIQVSARQNSWPSGSRIT